MPVSRHPLKRFTPLSRPEIFLNVFLWLFFWLLIFSALWRLEHSATATPPTGQPFFLYPSGWKLMLGVTVGSLLCWLVFNVPVYLNEPRNTNYLVDTFLVTLAGSVFLGTLFLTCDLLHYVLRLVWTVS